MKLRTVALVTTLLGVPLAAWAQHPPQPYASMRTRQIKALSAKQIADLKAGRGMGLAMAAELNGYPGPAHVLELADKLELKPDQRESVQRMLNAMKGEAIPIGEKLIAAEAELDRGFAAGTMTELQLQDQVQAIAKLEGELRFTHLKYHLGMVELLTPEQVARYNELRGYAGPADMPDTMPAGHMHQN